jgi:site-specific DNA-methyltransferase (adenine-specific)
MPENTPHPTQKPEKLMAKLILASSNEGGLVFEPFAGSGTASVVAKKLARRSIAIEQNPKFVALARYRLDCADEDKRIQGYDGVFYERNAKIKPSKD